MSEWSDLYQQVILDHNKNPRNYRKIDDADRFAKGHNPLCGDRIAIYLKMEGERVADVAFEGAGCAICTASASIMTQALKGKSAQEAEALFQRFHHMLTHDGPPEGALKDVDLGKLRMFEGVREYPVRVKCATLPWHTFHAALKDQEKTVSTE